MIKKKKKTRLGVLNDEKLNYIEKIQFLKIENKSLLERNNALA